MTFSGVLRPIGFDIDGTLVDHDEALEKLINNNFGTDYGISGKDGRLYNSGGFNKNVSLEVNKFIVSKYKDDFLVKILDMIEKIKLKNIELIARVRPVYIITSRERETFFPTVEFFKKRIPSLAGVVKSMGNHKSYQCKGLGCSLLVDDKFEVAEEVVKNCDTKVILPKKYYNVHEPLDNVLNVDGWNEAIDMIYELWKRGAA